MFIHSFDAFSGKPLAEKVCLSLWLVVWDSSALFLTYEMQPADTNWSYPSLQPYGHRGFQLKLSQTHLEDGDTLKSPLNKKVKGNRCWCWYHRQTADVKVGNWHWNSLSLVVHGRHLHNITLLHCSFSQANLQNSIKHPSTLRVA